MGIKQFALTVLAVIVALILFRVVMNYINKNKGTSTAASSASSSTGTTAATSGDSVLAYLNQNS
jgi:hypothetical protein